MRSHAGKFAYPTAHSPQSSEVLKLLEQMEHDVPFHRFLHVQLHPLLELPLTEAEWLVQFETAVQERKHAG